MNITTITLISAIAAAGSAVAAFIAALIAVKQLKAIYVQNRETHDWNRRKTTVDMVNVIVKGQEYTDLRSALFKYGFDIREPSPSGELLSSLDDEDARTAEELLRQLFNMFESVCVALKHNIVDEVIAKDMLMLFFVLWYRKCRPYLLDQNRDEGQQGRYGEFLVYAKLWDTEFLEETSQQTNEYVYRSRRDAKPALGQQ